MDSGIARRLDAMRDAVAQDALTHMYSLEVLLPRDEINKADRDETVGARTETDFQWKGPAQLGDSMAVCYEGVELVIKKVLHWPSMLTSFPDSEFTSLYFEGTREEIATILKNSGGDRVRWVPIQAYEKT